MRMRGILPLTLVILFLNGSTESIWAQDGNQATKADENQKDELPDTLDEMLVLAAQGNPDILLGRTKVREAQATLNETKLQVAYRVADIQRQIDAAIETSRLTEKTNAEQLEAAKDSFETAMSRYQSGKFDRPSREELTRAQAAFVLNQEEHKQQIASLEAQLKQHLGLSPQNSELPQPLDEMLVVAQRSNPAIALAQAKLESAQAALHQSRLQVTRRITELFQDYSLLGSGNDVEQKFAGASLAVAKKELGNAEEVNKRSSSAISELEMERLRLAVERAETKYELAAYQRLQKMSALSAELRYLLGKSEPAMQETGAFFYWHANPREEGDLREYSWTVRENQAAAETDSGRDPPAAQRDDEESKTLTAATGLPSRRHEYARPPMPEEFRSTMKEELGFRINPENNLNQILFMLRDLHGLSVLSDRGRIDEPLEQQVGAEIDADTRMRSALVALSDVYHDICFVFRDYGILVTTREAAQSMYSATIPEWVPLTVPPPAGTAFNSTFPAREPQPLFVTLYGDGEIRTGDLAYIPGTTHHPESVYQELLNHFRTHREANRISSGSRTYPIILEASEDADMSLVAKLIELAQQAGAHSLQIRNLNSGTVKEQIDLTSDTSESRTSDK